MKISYLWFPGLLGVAICDRYSKRWLRSLRRLHFISLRHFAGVIISPEPDHLLRELGRALARIVCALAEAEMKIVALQLQRIGETNVRERPASVTFQLQVLATVLQPHAQIAVRFMQNFLWKVLAAIWNRGIFLPLNAGKAANPGDHPAKLIRHLPRRIEGTNPARGKASNRAAVSVLADIVFGLDFCQHLPMQKPHIAIAYRVIKRAA